MQLDSESNNKKCCMLGRKGVLMFEDFNISMKKAFGISCVVDSGLSQVDFICSTILGYSIDMGVLLQWADENKHEMRMVDTFGYDEKEFDLWWDNVGFDYIKWDLELLEIVSK